jgi:hypothetical protein
MNLNEEIRNKNPFKVPDGYFETLTERTMKAISTTTEKDEKREDERPVRKISLRPFLALAAAILAVAVISTVIVRLVTRSDSSILSGGDNEIYAELYSEELDMYMIENEWSLKETELSPEGDTGLPADEIIDYLLMENIDISAIYELL